MALLVDDPKHIFKDEIWNHTNFTYNPPPIQFHGNGGIRSIYDVLPILLQLWEIFWPTTCMRSIVCESNSYAQTVIDAFGHTMGGPKWMPLTVAGLRAFIAFHIYMGLKKQLNVKTYWKGLGSFFHCPVISNIMSRDQFFELRRCLHIINLGTYEHIGRDNLEYDKNEASAMASEQDSGCVHELLGSWEICNG